MRGDIAEASLHPAEGVPQIDQSKGIKRSRWLLTAGIGIVAASLVAIGYVYSARTSKLTSIDTIVLADFANTTSESVFDDTR